MLFLKRHSTEPDLGSVDTTRLHRKLIREKPLLRRWYEIQYRKYLGLADSFPSGRHVELGSGGGFLKDMFPQAVTSSFLAEDVAAGFAELRLDAEALELADASVDSFFLLDVLHHLRDPRAFFSELTRCLKPGGFVFLVEPANTPFGRLLYKGFHHEGFDEDALRWGYCQPGPCPKPNQAVASNIFERDILLFEMEFPLLCVASLKKHTFLSYVLSGGLSYEPLLPPRLAGTVPFIERLAAPWRGLLGTYMDIHLVRR